MTIFFISFRLDLNRHLFFREDIDSSIPNEILSMRTNLNEINIHLLLSMDINRLREGGEIDIRVFN